MNFDYSRVPEKYRIGESASDMLILFRGDLVGLEQNGIQSKALREDLVQKINQTKDLIYSGDDEQIFNLINSHTSGSYESALISATLNPELAQVFATRNGTTIYRIEVPANRVIFDADNIGYSCESKEVLILGEIKPSEIKAIKIDNSKLESELLDYTEFGTRIIRHEPKRDSLNREVKNQNNWRLN